MRATRLGAGVILCCALRRVSTEICCLITLKQGGVIMKKLFVLLMVCVHVWRNSLPMIASAKAPPLTIVGDWTISGNVSVSATFTPYFTLTFALPNIGLYG